MTNKPIVLSMFIVAASALSFGTVSLAQPDNYYGNEQQMPRGMMMQNQQNPNQMGMMQRPGGMMGPNQMGGGPGGMGPMGGMHGMGPMSPMMMQQLNLNADQWDKVRDIMHKHQKGNYEKMGKMMDLRVEMQKLMSKPQPDANEVGQVMDKIFAIKREMMQNRIKTQNEIRGVLNKQQQEQYDAMRQGGMGMM